MTERITSMPAHVSVTCVQLPGQEIELARDQMANTSGGCILPGDNPLEENPLEHLDDIIDYVEDAVDDIYDVVSEWWDSW